MRMREDELHEPRRVRVTEPDGWNRCYKICTVCGLKTSGELDYNYCPKCGARWKSIEGDIERVREFQEALCGDTVLSEQKVREVEENYLAALINAEVENGTD